VTRRETGTVLVAKFPCIIMASEHLFYHGLPDLFVVVGATRQSSRFFFTRTLSDPGASVGGNLGHPILIRGVIIHGRKRLETGHTIVIAIDDELWCDVYAHALKGETQSVTRFFMCSPMEGELNHGHRSCCSPNTNLSSEVNSDDIFFTFAAPMQMIFNYNHCAIQSRLAAQETTCQTQRQNILRRYDTDEKSRGEIYYLLYNILQRTCLQIYRRWASPDAHS
jgi:hypothetical protein